MRVAIVILIVASCACPIASAADVREKLATEFLEAVGRRATDAEVSSILLKIVTESKVIGAQDETYVAALDALCKIARRTGDYVNCAQWSTDSAIAYESLGDLKSAAASYETAAAARADLSEFPEAERLYLLSIETLKKSPFRAGLNKAVYVEEAEEHLGQMYLDTFQLDKAKVIFSAHYAAEQRDKPAPIRKIAHLMNLARVSFLEQNWDDFDDWTGKLDQFLSSPDLNSRITDSPLRELALLQADSFLLRQQYEQAIVVIRSGLSIHSKLQLTRETMTLEHRRLYDRLAAAATASGDRAGAEIAERQYRQRISPILKGHRHLSVDTFRNRARTLAGEGQLAHAEYLLRRLLDDIKGLDDYNTRTTSHDLMLLAAIVREQGRIAEATAYISRAAAIQIEQPANQ